MKKERNKMLERNAIITRASLEIDDSNMLNSWIVMDYDGAGQSFGGYVLFNPETVLSSRNYAGVFIYRCMDVVGVNEWGKLNGKAVRVLIGEDRRIKAIGHIIKNKWFFVEEEFKQLEKSLK